VTAVASAGSVGSGQQFPNDPGSHYNTLRFIIDQVLGFVRTITPVQVVAVYGGGAENPPGTVDLQPLVNMLDGSGNSTPHEVVTNRPWLRVQCGNGAVVADPVVGDQGLMVVCDRDVSAVLNSGGQANPGSYRTFDFSDGVYVGGLLGSAPQQYVLFSATGVSVVDKSGNTIVTSAAGIVVTDVSGNTITTSSTGIAIASGTEITLTAPTILANGTPIG
jgi:hypothetical protein